MEITIHSLRFDADAKLLSFTESKVNKLDQYFDNIINADITLRLDKSDVAENKLVEIKLQIPGNDLFSKKQAKTFEEGVDLATEALRRQLKKTVDKMRGA